jgi:hypothetical protein
VITIASSGSRIRNLPRTLKNIEKLIHPCRAYLSRQKAPSRPCCATSSFTCTTSWAREMCHFVAGIGTTTDARSIPRFAGLIGIARIAGFYLSQVAMQGRIRWSTVVDIPDPCFRPNVSQPRLFPTTTMFVQSDRISFVLQLLILQYV